MRAAYPTSNRIFPTQPKSSSGNKRHRQHEVEAYTNPTELFRWINFCRWDKAVKRVKAAPSEAAVWIVSREPDQTLKWKYLPLHLVCLQPNPPRSIIKALVDAYPEAVKSRDNDGNLPIHYACTEGIDDGEVLKKIIEAEPNTLLELDNYGRTPLQILHNPIDTKKISSNVKELMSDIILWHQRQLRTTPNDYDETRGPPPEDYRRSSGTKTSHNNSRTNGNTERRDKDHSKPSKPKRISVKEISVSNRGRELEIEYESKIIELQAKIEKMEEIEKQKTDVIRDFELELKKKGESMEESEHRIKTLEQLLNNVTNENKKIQEQLNTNQTSALEFDTFQKKTADERSRLEGNIIRLEEELSKAVAKSSTMEAKFHEMKEFEFKDREMKLELEGRVMKLTTESASFQEKLRVIEDDRNNIKRKHEMELTQLTDKHDSITRKLENQISYLTDTNEAREKKIRIQEESLKEMTIMKDQIIELRELNNDYERKIEDQKCEFDSTMIRIQTALSKQASAFSQLQENPDDDTSMPDSDYINEELALDSENRMSKAQNQIRQLTLEKHDLKAETLSLVNKITTLENEVNVLSNKIMNTEDELREKNSLIKEMKQDIDLSYEPQLKQSYLKEEELQNEIDKLKKSLMSTPKSSVESIVSVKRDNEIERLESENEHLYVKVQVLTEEVADQKKKLCMMQRKNSLHDESENTRDDNILFMDKTSDSQNINPLNVIDMNGSHDKLQISNEDLKKTVEELKQQNQAYERKLNFLTSNKGVRQQLHGYDLAEKVTKLSSSLTKISSTQNKLVESTVQREKQFQDNAGVDRERLLQTICRQEKQMELAARKREQVMKALAKQEEDLQIAAAAERDKILALAIENEEDIFLSAATERESISQSMIDLEKEIKSLQIEIGFL